MNSKLIIIRGNSGSGKSTLAKALQHVLGRGTLMISQDVVRREMLWVLDNKGTKAISLLKELALYGKKHCEYVILEGILRADVYGELFEALLNEFDEIYGYYYDIPFEETLIRHQTKPNCNDFGEEAMRDWWREKDFIGCIPEKTISRDMSLEATLEQILEEVQS